MSIAGHVSRAMLSRYSHVRMEAKRRALDEIAARLVRQPQRSRTANPWPPTIAKYSNSFITVARMMAAA
jgi:hypothetical protein